MRQLEKFTTEAKALTAERLSLKTRAADKQRRAEIDEELEIIRGNSEALRVCLALEAEYLRARHSDKVTVRTGEAAAAAPVPLQQQPAKAQGFKVPDTKLFPQWSVGGRDEPLDLRRWFLGVERVLQTLRIEVSEWGRVVALILPSGTHQDWLYRYLEKNPGAGWETTVDAFVAAFQQQTSMDLLEAEWEALQQGTMTSC
jgi:hypothetical protein